MKRYPTTVFAGIALLALVAMASGCTPARQAGHPDPNPDISVRFPATESPNVNLRSEEPRKSPDELPLPNDEIHRPWLKAVEVTVTPGETAAPNGPAEPAK